MKEKTNSWFSGFAAAQSGKAWPFRALAILIPIARLRLAKSRRSLPNQSPTTVRQSLTALCGGKAAKRVQSLGVLAIFLGSLLALDPLSSAQSQRRSGAHSATPREIFTSADKTAVERAMATACAERIRDPLGSTPIDEMQARPSLATTNADAIVGANRDERLLPTTRRLVANAIVQLAKDYDLYGSAIARSRVNAATARVQAVKRVRPDVDARDNASVLLRDPRTIDFGTIFLAGLRSDEAMISVLAHELTHIANGRPESLRPLFFAIARRASLRTGFRIRGQRAEEL